MTSAISFGDTNVGFQAGIINGSANVVFNAAPGKLQGSKLTDANNDPSQRDQRPRRTRQSSYPSVATQTLSSEGYLIRFTRNVPSQGPEPHSLAWVAWGKCERFGEWGWLTATKQVAARHRIRIPNSRPVAGDVGFLGPREQRGPI
jgi:hypothetical protein